MTYGYDDANRLTSVTDWNSNAIAYAYDDSGRMTTKTLPSSTLMSFAYTYDAAGNRTSVTKDGGNAESYTLDSLNRLAGVTYADGTTQAYTYDATGNRLSLTVNGGTPVTYTYNDADQLTSDGTSTYAYDDNGNLVSRGSDTFTWDYASRMTGATVGSATATYAYDGEDTRVGKTVASTPTAYLWDRECGGDGCTMCEGGRCGDTCGPEASGAGVPLLIDDGTQSYLHAEGLVAEIASTTRLDHVADGLGSSRGLTSSSAAVAGTADYDVFGAPRATSGSTSAFGFTGEQSDPETGFTYLRARYLDPTTGRFGAVDTIIPNAPGTQGYNAYGYVAGNPTSWVDPSGHLVEPTVGKKTMTVAAVGLVALRVAIESAFYTIVCYLDDHCRRIATTIIRMVPAPPWPGTDEPGDNPTGEEGEQPGSETGEGPGDQPVTEPGPDPGGQTGPEPEPGGGGGISNRDRDRDRGRVKCDSRYNDRHHLIPQEMFRKYHQQIMATIGVKGVWTLRYVGNIKCIPRSHHRDIHNGWRGYAPRYNDFYHFWVSDSLAEGSFPGYLKWVLRRSQAINYYDLQGYPYTNGGWNAP